MKLSLRIKNVWRRTRGQRQVRPATLAERGQALVVIAMAMIGLLAFVGLTVDSGILFIGVGHLRRAVDAAALAAASQFREGRPYDSLLAAAREVVHLNGVEPSSLQLFWCDSNDTVLSHIEADLCPVHATDPHRKLIKVEAKTFVKFAFLGIIGIPSTEIDASATSEAASVDVVLTIDTSNSMTNDALTNGHPDMISTTLCNAADPTGAEDGIPGSCHPFQEVKQAAMNFISHLYYPYDRLAIVTFDNVGTLVEPITNTDTVDTWINIVKNLQVSPPRDPGKEPLCHWETTSPNDPSGCTNTSIGGGLLLAGSEFGRQPIRQESVWVVILLTDGAANASQPDPDNHAVVNEFCPMADWGAIVTTDGTNQRDPFCRDQNKLTRHTVLDPTIWGMTHTAPYNPVNTYAPLSYDAEDYARDNADFVACAAKINSAAQWCKDSLNYLHTPDAYGGQGALIYAIGLGRLVVHVGQGGHINNGDPGCTDPNPSDPLPYYCAIPASDPTAGYDAGDHLLKYIANVGADGDPDPNADPSKHKLEDPCLTWDIAHGPPVLTAGNDSYTCGNYYFSEFGTGLTSVFESIASRIFTRLTQ